MNHVDLPYIVFFAFLAFTMFCFLVVPKVLSIFERAVTKQYIVYYRSGDSLWHGTLQPNSDIAKQILQMLKDGKCNICLGRQDFDVKEY